MEIVNILILFLFLLSSVQPCKLIVPLLPLIPHVVELIVFIEPSFTSQITFGFNVGIVCGAGTTPGVLRGSICGRGDN